MNILITGGNGFIGKHLCRKFSNDNVVVIDRNNINPFNYCKYYNFDLCEYDKLQHIFELQKFDYVFHLAASAGVRYSIENPRKYILDNIMATVNLLECIKKYNLDIKKFVFASSSSVYGDVVADKYSENLELTSLKCPYAISKKCCEDLIKNYNYLYGINSVCLRFFSVYGPGQREDLFLPILIKNILNNQTTNIFGDGSVLRDYTYIDDIINGIIKSMYYNQTSFEIFNLGSGHPYSINEIISIVRNHFKDYNVKLNYQSNRKEESNKTYCDTSKSKKLLNFEAKMDIDNGILNYINSII